MNVCGVEMLVRHSVHMCIIYTLHTRMHPMYTVQYIYKYIKQDKSTQYALDEYEYSTKASWTDKPQQRPQWRKYGVTK